MIHLDTITSEMRKIALVVHDKLNSKYYLAGGTALALLSGHRESVDLDYFIGEHIDTQKLKDALLLCFPSAHFTYEDVDTLWCDIDGVKVSFVSRFDPLFDAPLNEEGFRIVGIRDLVAMKLNAICGGDEYKDYYDLVVLSRLSDVRTWPSLWKEIYPQSDQISWIVALAHVGSVSEAPLKGRDIRKKKEVEEIIQNLVKELSAFEER